MPSEWLQRWSPPVLLLLLAACTGDERGFPLTNGEAPTHADAGTSGDTTAGSDSTGGTGTHSGSGAADGSNSGSPGSTDATGSAGTSGSTDATGSADSSGSTGGGGGSGLGEECSTDDDCTAPAVCADTIPGLMTPVCGECATGAQCGPDQVCAFLGATGYRVCIEAGSLGQDALCPTEAGVPVGAACESGICSLYDMLPGVTVAVCGECTEASDCEDGEACQPPHSDPGTGQMMGSVCVPE